jgi:hypothetical protein
MNRRAARSDGTRSSYSVSGQGPAASQFIEISEFSTEVWYPFVEWVSTTYPEDAAVMYDGDPSTASERLTDESIRLWERHTREYVKEVKQGTA